MNQKLTEILSDFTDIMKSTDGILGAWNFGSASRGMSDEYSDADIVFLVEGGKFKETENSLEALLSRACDRVMLCREEGFNGEAIVNNGYLLCKGDEVFQFDVFLLNKDRIDDYMCRLHYTDLSEKDIVFDVNDDVKSLCESCPKGSRWNDDIKYLEKTYLYHFYMTTKYLIRKDYFKLNHVMRILFDTHASLLLTGYDAINWGGAENKLNFIPSEKQEHLKNYYCTEDFCVNKENLLKSAEWFKQDISDAFLKEGACYNTDNWSLVKGHWDKAVK